MLVPLSWMSGQWTSPGNGTSFTLRDLVASSQGVVTQDDTTKAYHIHQNLTIAPHDRLTVVPEDFATIDADAGGILCHGDLLLTIQGAIIVDCGDIDVYLEPDSTSHLRIELNHGTEASLFAHTKLFYLSGIKIVESDVVFDDCLFQSFDMLYTTGAVQYQNCDPVFTDCIFQGNYGSAIRSEADVSGSPQIDRCEFRYNVLSKIDLPQLDFGPGGDDTIRIRNSRVVGLYPLVGGIHIADPLGTGSTQVLLQGNFIADNRYGYHQEGLAIHAMIRDNEIVCNQIEPDPLDRGSGIRLDGVSDRCRATLRHNLIKGNHWGVMVLADAVVDMGTMDDYGNNILENNHHSAFGTDQTFALYVDGSHDVSAIGNYWGGATEDFAESVIYHRPDLGVEHGLVTYSPFLLVNDWTVTETVASRSNAYPNPTEGSFELTAGQGDGFAFEVYTLSGQRVLSGTTSSNTTRVDLQAFPAGVYAVVVRSDKGVVQTTRVIKK